MKINKDLTTGIAIGTVGMGLVSTLMMTVQKKSSEKALNKAYLKGVRDGMDGLVAINSMNDKIDQMTIDLRKFER